jgi:adenylate cyclase
VVDALLGSPDGLRLGGESRTVTLLMTDLCGFSSLSERLPPVSVIAMLNNCLSTLTDVILRVGGTIDEFIGDAILVLFGAPFAAEDDAECAVACALEMQLAMRSVNQWNQQNGFPALEMGIGIHTGQVVVGNIGSEKRSKYGVVGSAVNLTSRIESYTAGGQVLVSAATAEALGPRLRVEARRTVQPKGFGDPIEICDVQGIDGRYEVQIPATPDRLVPLKPSLPVRFVVFEGKDGSGPPCEGMFTELSERSARLRISVPLEPLCNVRLELYRSDGEPVAGYLMAKIVDGAESGFLIRFTAMEKDLQDFIETMVDP